jgi:arabinogalactan oligomer/maltooligosaccharide transport system permease protein
MLVTLSTLQTIDPGIYEAAMIDGASWFQQMIHITIPMIRSTVLPSVLLTSIWTFNNFNLVYLVTRGDNRYDILVTRIYDYILYPQVAAQQGWTYGFASAYSTLIFIILLVYIFIFAKASKITEKSF